MRGGGAGRCQSDLAGGAASGLEIKEHEQEFGRPQAGRPRAGRRPDLGLTSTTSGGKTLEVWGLEEPSRRSEVQILATCR